jgi:hypothetical protein
VTGPGRGLAWLSMHWLRARNLCEQPEAMADLFPIKCSQAIPACAQCIKAGKECPGYRNMLDLAFRNESESVIEKAKAKARKSSPEPKRVSTVPRERSNGGVDLMGRDTFTNTSTPKTSSTTRQTQSLDFPVTSASTFSMTSSLDDIGVNFFMSNFVAMANGPSHGYFDTVHDICQGEGFDPTLKASIIATGLAGYANGIKSSQLMAQARREYASSLQKINAALRSPPEAVKNSTLLSILVVALFETIAGAKQREFPRNSWYS